MEPIRGTWCMYIAGTAQRGTHGSSRISSQLQVEIATGIPVAGHVAELKNIAGFTRAAPTRHLPASVPGST